MNTEQKKKVFVFPENVSSSYGVFLGLSIKELGLYVSPVAVVGIVLFLIPPKTIVAVVIKVFFIVILLTIILAVMTSTPIPHRSNIKIIQHRQLKRNYKNRQRLFFKQKNTTD